MPEDFNQAEDAYDKELVETLKAGDGSAAAFLVSRHAPRLLGYVAAIANDIPETDRELICERVVETAASKIDDFDPAKGSFPGWLRGILRNEVKSWRRRSLARVELDEGVVADPGDYPPREIAETDPSAVLEPLLVQLALSDRLIIRLRDLEELPYSAIAAALDVREDACRQRHRRARDRLAALAITTTPDSGGTERDDR